VNQNVYTEIEGTGYTILKIESPTYSFNTVIDTAYVKYLKLFSWSKINTEGVYFAAMNTNETNRECIAPLQLPFEYGKQVLLHRLVVCLAKHPNPEGHRTVDHIDRETLDNRAENLRWLSQADQNRNTDKRNRKKGSQALPDDIEVPLPKYITWNVTHEKTSGDNILERKFFRVETHPEQKGKTWSTSKSAKFTNQQKLDQAKAELARLDALRDAPDPRAEKLFQEFSALTTHVQLA
jgi:hypothetical protein